MMKIRSKPGRSTWTALINKGRVGFVASDGNRICSNHFPDGRMPTARSPNPTLWLTVQDNRQNVLFGKVISNNDRGCSFSSIEIIGIHRNQNKSVELLPTLVLTDTIASSQSTLLSLRTGVVWRASFGLG